MIFIYELVIELETKKMALKFAMRHGLLQSIPTVCVYNGYAVYFDKTKARNDVITRYRCLNNSGICIDRIF